MTLRPHHFAVALLVLLMAPAASAHAVADTSDPPRNARLLESPDRIWVTFTEEIYAEGSWIQVWNSENRRVDNDDLVQTFGLRPQMEITVTDLPDGAYRILWQTYSKTDGHTVGGALGFAIGGFAPPESELTGTDTPPPASALGRALLYAGYALALGAFAWAWRIEAPSSRIQRSTLLGGALATAGLVVLLLDTQRLTGLPLETYLQSDGGRGLIVRTAWAGGLLGLTAAWAIARRDGAVQRLVLAGGWTALVWLGAQVGHASIAGPSAIVVQFIHALAISIWLGGLMQLMLFLRDADREQAWWAGRRFGTMALYLVIAIALTGFMLSVTILGPSTLTAAPWTSMWGIALAMKLAMMAMMIALAFLNRYVWLADDAEMQRFAPLHERMWRWKAWKPIRLGGRPRSLAGLVRMEAMTGAMVLIAAGMLMSVAVPQGLAAEADAWEAPATGDDFIGTVTFDPAPTAGADHVVRVFIADAESDEPVAEASCSSGRCLLLTWWPADDPDQAASFIDLRPEGDGWWRAEGVLLTSSGDHVGQLVLQTAAVPRAELSFELPVAATA